MDEQPAVRISVARRIATIAIFVSTLVAIYLVFRIGFSSAEPTQVWTRHLLMAYFFGTMAVPYRVADLLQPVGTMLRAWCLALLIAAAVWIVPLALAPTFGWSFGSCADFSLIACLLPAFVEPIGKIVASLRSEGRQETQA